MIKKLTRDELDKLCDMVWWLKGYATGAKDCFENCPFNEKHIAALYKVIANEKELTYGPPSEQIKQISTAERP